MFEKVNPSHPDKLADRIAGAIVDMAYARETNPRVAVEVLLGHGTCYVMAETSEELNQGEVGRAVRRIAGIGHTVIHCWPQDWHLAENQRDGLRCGDNGIFAGAPVTEEQRELTNVMRDLYALYPTDGKAVVDGNRLVLCQSKMPEAGEDFLPITDYEAEVNPLGFWTGGPDVDCGATNRKLGSDMGDAVTGGGLHGKDLSKADVSVNIMCHLLAQVNLQRCQAVCAIGDESITFEFDRIEPITMDYQDVVKTAGRYVGELGGFERFAEWGLIR